jgi:DNA/RNA-binding domain of Phe-tRNA-synthetase-like protein
MQFRITPPISAKFPELFVNLSIVTGFNNKPAQSVADEILTFLRSSEDGLRARFSAKDELYADPYVVAYFELFQSFGVNPRRVKPSHVALAERVVKGGSLPDISPAVNLYNAFSVRYLVPFGGENLDKVDEFFEMTIARGDEAWTGIGETEPISPIRGDVIWQDASEVSTISLNHRQCEKTKLTQDTVNSYFICEGLSGVNKDHIATVTKEFLERFTHYLGGESHQYLLTAEEPVATL